MGMTPRLSAPTLSALLLWFFCALGAPSMAHAAGLEDGADDGATVAQKAGDVDGLGHRLHPVHGPGGIRLSGALTIVTQGALVKGHPDPEGALSLSADITLESNVGRDGSVAAVLDFQRGEGLAGLPALFTGPNNSATGPNADVESFDSAVVNVAQFYYEHRFGEALFVSVGQLDPASYLDANEYANNERTQFLANVFVNNPTVEFGGSEDFYGPGARLTYRPAEVVELTLGAFEGDGDYAEVFDGPFLMAEANLKLRPGSRAGNLRVYGWERQGRGAIDNTADPTDASLYGEANRGAGISLDQEIRDSVGVWLRAGAERETVAQFDRFVGLGMCVNGAGYGRPLDTLGLGYAMTFMGERYMGFKKGVDPAFEEGVEHYIEVYYGVAATGASEHAGLYISPDVQYVMNPGGDVNAGDSFIYGVRAQAFF
jgi:carbohydrate-selective porin OprB